MANKKNKKLSEKDVWKGTILRAVALFGLVFSSNCLTLGYSQQILSSSLLLGLLYYFSELARYYNFSPREFLSGINRQGLETKNKRGYAFLLW